MTDIHFDVLGLDIKRAHDGLFRGDPEPVVLIATYALGEEGPTTLDVRRAAFEARSPFPKRVKSPLDAWTLSTDRTLVVLAVALEEDGGDDIARIERSLRRANELRLWPEGERLEDGVPLSELPNQATSWRAPNACDVEVRTGALSTSCSWDKWIGAAAWLEQPLERPGVGVERHAHFVSLFHRNDWTLVLHTR